MHAPPRGMVPKVVESAERPASAPNEESDGWIRLDPEHPPSIIQSGTLALRQSGAAYWPVSLIALIPFASQVGHWGVSSILILIVVGAPIVAVIVRRRMRPPWVAISP